MAYVPPSFDDASSQFVPAPEQPPAPSGFRLPGAPARVGVTTMGGGGTSYAALGAEDDEDTAEEQRRRANDIAMRSQQQNEASFMREVARNEERQKSEGLQLQRDEELAAQLAAGSEQVVDVGAARSAQSDAALAARLQAQEDARAPPAPSGGGGQRQQRQKIVRVVVPRSAKAGDSLAVATPTAGKFQVTVPSFCRPGDAFDCVVTTIIEVRPPGADAREVQPSYSPPAAAYQPPAAPSSALPPGWEAGQNPDGVPFYVDHNTRTTHWTRPTVENPIHSPAQPRPAAPAPAPPPPRPDFQPEGMSEEEMIAQAIALSEQEARSPETAQPPPAPEEPDLLGLSLQDPTAQVH